MPDLRAKLAYTAAEAVDILPWGKTKVFELIASGEIPSRLKHGRRYIMHDDLVALRQGPNPPNACSATASPAEKRATPAPRCGVYILVRQGVYAYVGRSTELQTRISAHRRSGRVFDEVKIIPCPLDVAEWLEAELIRTLRPSDNLVRYERRATIAQRELREAGLA